MTIRVFMAAACGAAALSAITACGGGSASSPSSSSSSGSCLSTGATPTTPSTTPAGAVRTSTITISNCIAAPKDIIVTRGTQVTIINNDTQPHNITSNPHPEHTDCPEINAVGVISVGQTKRTDNMITNRVVCGFHDHDRPDVAGLQGSITIQ